MQALGKFKRKLMQKDHLALMFMLLLLNLLNPFVNNHAGANWILDALFVLVLLSAASTVASHKRIFIIILVLGVTAIFSHISLFVPGLRWIDLTGYVVKPAFLFLTCGLLLKDIVLRSKEVTRDVIIGAVNVYLMVGVAFACTYALIEFLQPGSFTGMEKLIDSPNSQLFFLYFSFITLTTLGYGDISPLTPVGMSTAYIEAIFGQLYLAILVARLVAMYIGNSSKTNETQNQGPK